MVCSTRKAAKETWAMQSPCSRKHFVLAAFLVLPCSGRAVGWFLSVAVAVAVAVAVGVAGTGAVSVAGAVGVAGAVA